MDDRLDLSDASWGREVEFYGGPHCGETGVTIDYLGCADDGELIDYLAEMKAGYVEFRVGSRLIFTWDQTLGTA